MTMAEQMARDVAKRWSKKAGTRHQYSEDRESPGWCRCGLRKDEIDHEPEPVAAPKFGEKPAKRRPQDKRR